MKNTRCNAMKMASLLTILGFATLANTQQAQAQTLYGHDNISHDLVTINPATAAVTTVGASGLSSTVRIGTLAYHPTDGLFGLGYDTSDALYHFYNFNTSTGAATSISTLGIAASSADGLEYVAGSTNSLILFKSLANNFYGSELNTVNPITGAITATGVSTGSETDNDYGVYDSLRNKYYTMDDNHFSIRGINTLTGSITPYSTLNLHYGDGAYSASLDQILHTGETGTNLYQINPVSLSSPTLIGSFGAGKEIIGIAVGPSAGVAAPEPGTLALIAIGGMGFVSRLRLRRRK
jgi:hypothetical protein